MLLLLRMVIGLAVWLSSFGQQPSTVPPLYVVDGFRFPKGTPESFFVSAEILSASVYKDVAAMRQRYGTAAADGVLELKVSTPFLLDNKLLRTPQDKARALHRLTKRNIAAVSRLSTAESRQYGVPAGQTIIVVTPAP